RMFAERLAGVVFVDDRHGADDRPRGVFRDRRVAHRDRGWGFVGVGVGGMSGWLRVKSTVVGGDDANAYGRFCFMVERYASLKLQLTADDLEAGTGDIAAPQVFLHNDRMLAERLAGVVFVDDLHGADDRPRRVFRDRQVAHRDVGRGFVGI